MKLKGGLTKKNSVITILIALAVFVNNYLGYVAPPLSIEFTPILLGFSTLLIFVFTDYRLEYKYSIVTAIILLNDMLIKIYAGGSHDLEGIGWIHLFLFIGLLISLIVIVIYSLSNKINRGKSFLYLGCSAILLLLYLSYFNTFGTKLIQYPFEEKSEAKQNGLFLYNIRFSDSCIVAGNDTVRLTEGWVQKEVRLNHLGLLKKIEDTHNNICLFRLSGKTNSTNSGMIYYNTSDGQSGGPVIRREINSIQINKTNKRFFIAFYQNSKMLKKIWVEPAAVM